MTKQTENDRITQILLNMSRDELIAARAEILATFNRTRMISLRRILKGKIELIDAQLADRHENDLTDIPAAACGKCGGWTSFGGCSQHANSSTPVMNRTGCDCRSSNDDSPKSSPFTTTQA